MLFARQLGYLHSIPEKSKEARIVQLEQSGQPDGLPEIDDFLISDFMEIGPSRRDAAGDHAIKDPDIWFFSQNTGIVFDIDERRVLMRMSTAYCNAKYEGREPGAIAPIHQTGDPTQDRRNAVAAGFSSILRHAAKGGDK